MLKHADWLNTRQKELLLSHVDSLALESAQKNKLLAILASIPYAEKKMKELGKNYIRNLEALFDYLGCQHLLCRSVSAWNIHSCHASRFHYNPVQFKKALKDESFAISCASHLLQAIGLQKKEELIFAEYNHNIGATTIAALQKALNYLSKGKLQVIEDGLMGKQTQDALFKCSEWSLIKLPASRASEEVILDFLAELNKKENCSIEPFVPQVCFQMDMRFVQNQIKAGIKNPSELKKIWHVFFNHINVPIYVVHAMSSYEKLLSISKELP